VAIALLPEVCEPQERSVVTATRVIVCSPIRAADGSLRTLRESVPADGCLQTVIPPSLHEAQVSVNGGLVAVEDWPAWQLLAGDEVLIIPRWGDPVLTPFLIAAAIGLVVSIAATALSYVLFPPPKAHNIAHTPEEPSFSFEGIRTTLGPGAVVPVIYGRQRTGGQLLHSAVDQQLTVLDDGLSSRRITAIAAPATLSLLLALGEGPVNAINPETIEINGQPIGNFPGVQVYTALGTDPQAPLPTFGESANTFSFGQVLHDIGSVIYTTTAPVEAFVLNVAFQSGLYGFNGKGEKIDNTVTVQYRFRVHEPQGAWSAFSAYEVVAQRTSVVRLGIRRENLALAQYDIEFNLADVRFMANAQWEPMLESVTEVQHNTQAYPGTALLGLRAVATDTLQGALPNVTVEVQGRTVRQDTFTSLQVWSDNPAWCTMDFLTNGRYGLGIPDSQIDLGSFVAWAAYCNQIIDGEKRHILNYTLDRDVRAQQVLLEMAGSARTLLFKSEGVWIARPTRDDPPVLLLSWANCTDLKLTYTRDPDRVNVIETRFSNEAQGFEQDVLTWPILDNWPPEVRKSSLELRGVTKPSRVMRAMQFELNRRRWENLGLEVTCNLEAVPLQPHDLFRFSHPLPGWGFSGRIQSGSTQSFLHLDQDVAFTGSHSYLVYVRYQDGSTEVKPVSYPGDGHARTLTLLAPLEQVPTPRTSLYAFGYQVGPADTAVKIFRVIQLQRTSDHRVRIQAMIHNASIYDEPTAEPLPITTLLFNPLGPPPGLTSLVLTEVVRIQSSGASMRVVNVSWDVDALGPGFAPYGGALILRRTVQESSGGGTGVMGITTMGLVQAATDLNINYTPITQVSGHILDWDDYTVVSGVTYVYRVVPMSSRGVPNYPGAREAVIHVAGPTTPDFFPGSISGLRLEGGGTTFEGRNAHFLWDAANQTGLFNETFYVVDYVVEIWAPGQLYLMHRTSVAARGPGVTLDWTYTLEQNAEDQVAAGQSGARRDFMILVWARTNTGRVSLNPASLSVSNPPPDMGDMQPVVTASFGGSALISFDQFIEPRDFDHYQVFLDTVNPPQAIYEEVSIAIHRQGRAIRKLNPTGLTVGATYFVYILPYDTFGPGIPTGIVSFVVGGITIDEIDITPPAMPTGLALTSGTLMSPDGTIMPWVQASWAANIESDMAAYEVHFRLGTSTVPTVMSVDASRTALRLESVPGNTLVSARMLAYDQFHNASPFTAEVTTTTAGDTVPPAAPTNLVPFGTANSIHLLWTPPPDFDYSHSLVYANQSNNFASSSIFGTGKHSYDFNPQGQNTVWYFWLRAVDTSGNVSVATFPASPTGGVSQLAGLVDSTYISSLVADKIATGTLQVTVQIGVGGQNLYLDGVNRLISVTDDNAITRVVLGKLGTLSSQYGLQLFGPTGQLMWNFTTGATTAGINDAAITAQKIAAAQIQAVHLVTDTAVITGRAQIANATIDDAHIVTLSATKIIASSLNVLMQIGVGALEQVFIDGNNANMYFYDAQATPILRGMLGRLGGGSQEFGLRLWNASGALMWDFNTGASSLGIQDLAVTNAKIQSLTASKITSGVIQGNLITVGPLQRITFDGFNDQIYVYDVPGQIRILLGRIAGGSTDYGLQIWNAAGVLMWDFTSGAQTQGINAFAVTTSLTFVANGNILTSLSEIEVATLTFPSLDNNDQVWLVGVVTAVTSDGADTLSLRIREDSLSGAIVHDALFQHVGGGRGSVTVQGVMTAVGSGIVNKVFKLSIVNVSSSANVSCINRSFVAFRRRR
jgi:predicted phage tail protein